MIKKRLALTLIEMMLVIILIGIVGGALAYNLKGAIDKGRSFKTIETKKRIDTILNMALLDGHDPYDIQRDWQQIVEESPLIKITKKKDHLKDGWGEFYNVEVDDEGSLRAFSSHVQMDEDD